MAQKRKAFEDIFGINEKRRAAPSSDLEITQDPATICFRQGKIENLINVQCEIYLT